MSTNCTHSGLRGFCTDYDRHLGVMVYFWTCEGCGALLDEARREEYRPSFDPRGNDPYLSAAR
jgi:hypothetical protein